MKPTIILTIFIFLFISANAQPALNEEMYRVGGLHAEQYYKKYKVAGTSILAASLVTGCIFSLIPAVACSSAPPQDFNLAFPDSSLLKTHEYYLGYLSQATKKKSRHVWINYAIGSIINGVVVTYLIVDSRKSN